MCAIRTQNDLYGSYCPAWALSWNYRRQNLLRELLSYNADILCLQEARGFMRLAYRLLMLTRLPALPPADPVGPL